MAISNSKPSKPLNYQRVTLHKITPPIGPGSWMFEMCHMSTRAIQKVRPGRSLRDVHSAWGLKTIVADLIHGLWRMRSRKDPGSVSSSRESLGFTVVRTSRVRRSFDFWKCLGIWYLDISGLLYKNSPTSNHQKNIRFFLMVFFLVTSQWGRYKNYPEQFYTSQIASLENPIHLPLFRHAMRKISQSSVSGIQVIWCCVKWMPFFVDC